MQATPPFPNFIYAGAPKAGSSTLWNLISQHPDFFPCRVKEPFYFDFNYKKGEAWYRSLFDGWAGEHVIGEATVWYMRWAECAERIQQLLPNTKFLAVLRNPVERARSNFYADMCSGHYTPDRQLLSLLDNDDRLILSAGRYYEQLSRFFRLFSREQFLVLIYEEAMQDLRETAARIFDFLGIDRSYEPVDLSSLMVSRRLRSKSLLQQVFLFSQKAAPSQVSAIHWAWQRSRHIRRLCTASGAERLALEEYRTLENYYRTDAEQLAVLLGKDVMNTWGFTKNL